MALLLLFCLSGDSLSFSYFYFSRGYQYELRGDFSKAIDLYQKAKIYNRESSEIDYYIARIKLMSGDYNGARGIVRRLLKRSEEFEYLQLLGDCDLKMGKIESAISSYKKALSIRPDEYLIYRLAALLESIGRLKEALAYYQGIPSSQADPDLIVRIASLLGRLGRPRQVIDYLRQIPAQQQGDYFLNLAIAYDQLAIRDSALFNYQRALEIDSANITVMKRLIDLYIQADSLGTARNIGDRAIELAPYDQGLHRSLGYLYYKLTRFEKALSHFLIAIGLDGLDLYSTYYVGRIFFEKHQFKTAVDYLNRALTINPRFPDAHLYLGLIAMDSRDFRKARIHFAKAIALGFDRAEGIYLIGTSDIMEGDLEGGYLNFLTANKLRPDDPHILSGLGDVCDELGRYGEAFGYFSRVIELDSASGVALNYVGYTYAEKGDSLEYALQLVKKALKIDSTNGYYIDTLGWIYFKMGDYEQALKELLRAKGMIEDAVILEHIGDVYMKLNNLDQARDAYERAAELEPNNQTLKEKIKTIETRY